MRSEIISSSAAAQKPADIAPEMIAPILGQMAVIQLRARYASGSRGGDLLTATTIRSTGGTQVLRGFLAKSRLFSSIEVCCGAELP